MLSGEQIISKVRLCLAFKHIPRYSKAHNLRNPNMNNFQLGATDVFGPDEIENCFNFELLSNSITRLALWHCGTDAWFGKAS